MPHAIKELIEMTRIASEQAQFYAEELQVFQEEAAAQSARTSNRLKEVNARSDAARR